MLVRSLGQKDPLEEGMAGGRNNNPLQYSCLENPTDRGAWRALIQRVANSQKQLKRLSTHISN